MNILVCLCRLYFSRCAPLTPIPPTVFQETLFGRTLTPAERLRQNQRSLAKAQRELDRERTKLEQQEKKLIIDIKKSAKAGQIVRHCRVLVSRLLIQPSIMLLPGGESLPPAPRGYISCLECV
jgi:hypothetical protein